MFFPTFNYGSRSVNKAQKRTNLINRLWFKMSIMGSIVVLLILSTAFCTTANVVPTKTKSGPWTIMSNGAKSVHSGNEMVQMKFFSNVPSAIGKRIGVKSEIQSDELQKTLLNIFDNLLTAVSKRIGEIQSDL